MQVGQILGLFMAGKGPSTPIRIGELVKHKSEAAKVVFVITRKVYTQNQHRKKLEKRDR